MTTFLVCLVILTFILGAELFAVMLLAAAVGAMTLAKGYTAEFDGMVVSMFGVGTGDHATVLSTIPMFIYAGYLLAEAGTADRLVRFANALVGWIPGGLAIVTIYTCAIFTTFTGASGVTIVALGGVLLPALVKSGYPKRFSMGLLAGTGSVGLLWPPALPLFIYGTIYGLQLVGDPVAAGDWNTLRFAAAGVVPGFVLVNALCLVAVWKARKLPTQPFEIGELGKSFVKVLPELFIPIGVLAGLLVFSFSLPEIASLTLVYVIVLELGIMRAIRPRTLWSVSREAMTMVGAIFVIILCSTVFTNYIVTAEVPAKLVDWATQYVDSRIVFLLALNLLLLVVGMIMDIFSAIVIVLPLIVPISRHYGIDPYHLGIIFLLNLEVGYLTPPVGLNLFITSIKFKTPVDEVLRATTPFLLTMIVVLGIVTYVPALTVVPPAERTAPINNLVLVARAGVQESKVSIAEFTLVDATGKELVGANGKPVVRKFADCERIVDAFGKPMVDEKTKQPLVPSQSQLDACQAPFFDITACMPGGNSTDPAQLACKHKAIAKWTAERYNEEYPAQSIIVVETVPLADAAGAPLTYEVELRDKDGKPVLDELQMPKKEAKAIVGPDGKPFVRTFEWCKTLEFKSDQERCRTLFSAASACKISPEAPDEDCAEEKCPESEAASDEGSGSAGSAAAGSGSAAPVDRKTCLSNAAAECVKAKYDECIAEAAKSWADENPSIARDPKIAGGAAKRGPGEQEAAGGCSNTGGAAGVGFGILVVFLLMRRRQP